MTTTCNHHKENDMSDYYGDYDDEDAENGPEAAPKAPFWDRVRFVPLATYKRLQNLLDAVEDKAADDGARHRAAYAEAMAAVGRVAAERNALKRELERARMTPQTKADTEAAYQRGFATAHRNIGQYLLLNTIPESTAKAKELVAAARALREPLPVETDVTPPETPDNTPDNTPDTTKENDQ